jgi:hypothetical protein
MSKRFYLSTRKDRNAEAGPLVEALKATGWERTFDWANRGASTASEYADLAVAEIAVLLPGGYGTPAIRGVLADVSGADASPRPD